MYSWNEAVREAHETWLLTNRISHTLSERIRYSAIEHLLYFCHELRRLAAAIVLGVNRKETKKMFLSSGTSVHLWLLDDLYRHFLLFPIRLPVMAAATEFEVIASTGTLFFIRSIYLYESDF